MHVVSSCNDAIGSVLVSVYYVDNNDASLIQGHMLTSGMLRPCQPISIVTTVQGSLGSWNTCTCTCLLGLGECIALMIMNILSKRNTPG